MTKQKKTMTTEQYSGGHVKRRRGRPANGLEKAYHYIWQFVLFNRGARRRRRLRAESQIYQESRPGTFSHAESASVMQAFAKKTLIIAPFRSTQTAKIFGISVWMVTSVSAAAIRPQDADDVLCASDEHPCIGLVAYRRY